MRTRSPFTVLAAWQHSEEARRALRVLWTTACWFDWECATPAKHLKMAFSPAIALLVVRVNPCPLWRVQGHCQWRRSRLWKGRRGKSAVTIYPRQDEKSAKRLFLQPAGPECVQQGLHQVNEERQGSENCSRAVFKAGYPMLGEKREWKAPEHPKLWLSQRT